MILARLIFKAPYIRCFCSSSNNNQGKLLQLVVTSLRVDRILATGFAIGRRKAEYSLLKGLVKINGKTVTKKSVEVNEGDIIDQFSLEKTTEFVYNLDRLELLEIGDLTKKGNQKVTLRKTRNFTIDKEDYRESF